MDRGFRRPAPLRPEPSPWTGFLALAAGVHLAALALVALLASRYPSPSPPPRPPPPSVVAVTLVEERVAVLRREPAQPIPCRGPGCGPGASIDPPREAPSTPVWEVADAPPAPDPSPLGPRETAPGAPVARRPDPSRSPGPRLLRPAAIVVRTTHAEPDDWELPGGAAGDSVGDSGGHPAAGTFGSLALGPPEDPLVVSLGSPDPRFVDYLAAVARLLEPEWRDAFPRERALLMQQGEVVIEWVVERDGSVTGPRVLRPSGVPVFDRNVVAGFRRAAARFPAPPSSMPLPLRVRAPYRFRNPMFD